MRDGVESERWIDIATRPAEIAVNAVVRVFRVAPESAGMRLDVFLAAQLRNTSRTRAKLIAENAVFSLDGKKLRPNDRLRAEDHVALWRVPPAACPQATGGVPVDPPSGFPRVGGLGPGRPDETITFPAVRAC